MKGFLCLLVGVLLVSCVSAGLYGKNSNVVQLTTDNFAKEVFGSNDVWIIEVSAHRRGRHGCHGRHGVLWCDEI